MIRAMIPHGDRRDRAESGCIEDEVALIRPLDDDVMRVLVLGQDVRDRSRGLLSTEPGEHVAERSLILQLTLE